MRNDLDPLPDDDPIHLGWFIVMMLALAGVPLAVGAGLLYLVMGA